ncbi:MAG: type II secretory pathway, component PulD [Puniceicoccaceae bacterium MED-G30]|nr:MAG: type II secretory pathway, component PulD [Puniceicoccaceae bacterium MED-G30]
MTMKSIINPARRLASCVAATAMLVALMAPLSSTAQDSSEKIRLMAETLRARDAGDWATAKEKAEALIKIAPDDENVQRLNASITSEMDSQASSADASVEEASAPAETSALEAAATAQEAKVAAAENAIDEAGKLADLGAYSDANNLLSEASASLDLNTATAGTIADLEEAQAQVIFTEAETLAEAGDYKQAEKRVADYLAAGGSASKARSLSNELDAAIRDPYAVDINAASPDYISTGEIVRDLITKGRSQFLNGDYDGAAATFKEVEARDANNAEAKLFSTRIAKVLGAIHDQNLYKTREQMLTEVDQQWERPKVFDIATREAQVSGVSGRIAEKMNTIVVPSVNFTNVPLSRVVETLSDLSVEYDSQKEGVNIVLLTSGQQGDPMVNIKLRKLNLDRILSFVTQQVNFSYDVGEDAVTVAPSGDVPGGIASITEFFPISRATIIRLTGISDESGISSGPVDPFAAPVAASGGGASSSDEKSEALKAFFQRAGVNFEVPGASLAFDGEQIIVTQSRRNLERMRTILRNYNEVKQVEIEAKFLEVAQNDLDQLGFDWTLTNGDNVVAQFNPRNLQDAFGVDTDSSAIRIKSPTSIVLDANGLPVQDANGNNLTEGGLNENVSVNPPQQPDILDLGVGAVSTFAKTGTQAFRMGDYDLDFAINAISRKTGSDLMSAPKVTVLSGKRAEITVAQELRYPESYGDIESQVSQGSTTGGGGSSISITAGTPEDFVVRNVGVELAVTPNVENDDTISLILEPQVTEFEGFVEYGGPSVAVGTDGTVVTVPAGFYQPIFSTRKVSTEVTIFDGATVVLGGLTRDEVKYVNDKVPVLGDIPMLGKLFSSEGETRQKRNLLIFVTANLVSPGGSPARQNYRNVAANSLFQNPTIMTPSGTANRSITNDSDE